eukprot:TRINITY_DN1385_c0_g1_i1.p2 TRINITY_DN1385_c0_g1~~TRINITY_DN1385_c0_g1_i1.p2  ORF type:complete len:228 (+),score=39.95 TRINITY_DN1385_c0_g1_i1:111-794(+)
MRFSVAMVVALCLLATFAMALEAPMRQEDELPNYPYRFLGVFEATHAAFTYFNQFNPSEPVSLWITTFSGNPFDSDEIFNVNNFAAVVAKGGVAINATHPLGFTTEVTWPNQAIAAPYDVFNASVLVAAGGFLVPGKSTGGVYLFNLDLKQNLKISTDKSGWFYHRTVFLDVDGDGLQDIITARATKPIFGSAGSELVTRCVMPMLTLLFVMNTSILWTHTITNRCG